jgi:hypothetical protein
MTLLDEFLGKEDYAVRVRKAEKAHRLSKEMTTKRFSSTLYGLFSILLRI